jgi:hypothetical protein
MGWGRWLVALAGGSASLRRSCPRYPIRSGRVFGMPATHAAQHNTAPTTQYNTTPRSTVRRLHTPRTGPRTTSNTTSNTTYNPSTSPETDTASNSPTSNIHGAPHGRVGLDRSGGHRPRTVHINAPFVIGISPRQGGKRPCVAQKSTAHRSSPMRGHHHHGPSPSR